MPSSSAPPKRVVIAGGGIGGLAATLALQQHGIHSIVCEQAAELREVGAGLLLSPNAVRVLEALGIGDVARSVGRVIGEWRILDPHGRRLHAMRAEHDRISTLSLHRADLQRLLCDRVPRQTLKLGFTVAGCNETDAAVEIQSSSGEHMRGDVLIGADGLRSRVRALRFDDTAPRCCGYAGWRSVVATIPRGYESGWLSESWGEGKRFGIAPLGGGRCYWYASANVTSNSAAPPGCRRAELLELFAHWHAPIPELIASTPEEAILLNDIFDRPPRASWTRGRVALLGDAAHPMSPNLGQGACMALEDAWVLARELARARSWPEGLAAYEWARRARTACISYASRFLGEVIQLEHPLGTRARDVMLRLTPAISSRIAMRPLFAFRL
jgi:2-polyprenyl-6-methoxyphenol hydroxylase-like FAD-dependent oxidoreductase